jgi:hypothetical protein
MQRILLHSSYSRNENSEEWKNFLLTRVLTRMRFPLIPRPVRTPHARLSETTKPIRQTA